LGVRRDNSPPDCCLSPAHPPDTRLPRALLLPRPHPCRLGASIRAGDGLGNKCSIHISGDARRCMGQWIQGARSKIQDTRETGALCLTVDG
jgi:hypothetical protein